MTRNGAVILWLILLLQAGCGHEVVPTDDWSDPASIPVPTQLQVRPGQLGPFVTWVTPDSDFVVVQGWHVDRQSPGGVRTRLTSQPVQQRQFQDTDTPQVGITLYWVRAVSRGGVESVDTPPFRFPWDAEPPATPTGLTVQYEPSRIVLFWTAGLEFDLAGYRLYRDGVAIGDVNDPAQPVYADFSVVRGRPYSYQVAAFDFTGLESPPSPAVVATLP